MTNITALHAKTHFTKILSRVTRGEEVVITQDRKPVARLIPECLPSPTSVADAVDQLRANRTKWETRRSGKSKVTLVQFKSAVAEGRR